VIEAVGSTELLTQGLRALADGGQIAVYGVPPVLEAPLNWSGLAPSWQLRFIRPREDAVHQHALDLIRLGFLDLRSFVTHVLPLAEIGEAFQMLDDKQALKIAIRIDEGGS
jgi:threonine dehydrogenase-like Zn-dependent dehydrogenase